MAQDGKRIFGGILLVAGTTIGGGMLGLPVLIGVAGFLPSIFISLLCWLFMASTGLLFLEVSQWLKGESNIISMAEKTMGIFGKSFAWILYLFLFNCLMVAYIVGCGDLVVQLFQEKIPVWSGPIIFVLIFSPLIIIPTFFATRFNNCLVVGLALSYVGVISLGLHYVNVDLLLKANWSQSFHILPIAFISFAFQGIIPTLSTYMHGNIPNIRKAIIIGSFIPLIAYTLWNGLILGIVPFEGEGGLLEALKNGDNAVAPLEKFINNPMVYDMGQAFAFFALITSCLGVALGLRDFLADGLRIKRDLKGKIILAFLVCTFPLIIAISYPHIFLIALEYAGGFGSALLLGLLPIIMAWRGRYHLKLPRKDQIPGGRFTLIILGIFVCFEIITESKQLLERLFS